MIQQLHALTLALSLIFQVSTGQEVRALESGKPVEREIAGSESHTYQIELAAGQFVRFRLEQRAMNSILILTAPDGKQLVEMNLTGIGEQESFSLEAAIPGSYRLTVRGDGLATLRGSYRVEVSVQAEVTAQDRKRLTAEALLVEANGLRKQAGLTAQQVIEKLDQALPIWRELGEPPWIAYSLFITGAAYADLSENQKATTSYEQALAVSREFKLRAREGLTLNGLGETCYNLKRFEKAIEYYEQALPIRREVKDRMGEGSTLNNLGLTYLTMRRFERVFEYYEQALAIIRELKVRSAEGWMLHDLGQAHMMLSHSEEAIVNFEQALAVFREVNDRQGEASGLESLGMLNMSLSRSEKAIEYYEQGLAIRRKEKHRIEEGYTLTLLGGAYAALGRYEKAIEYSEQALAISRETKARWAEGRTLYDLGATSIKQGRTEKAIEYLEQALPINREVKDRMVEGYTLSALGSTFVKQMRIEKAIEYFEQALVIYRDIKRRPQEGSTLNSLGEVYRALGQYEKAIQCSEQALSISREVKNPEYEIGALSNLARTENERGNLPQARTLIEEGLRVAESLRTAEIKSPTSRASFLASVQSSYQLYTNILMRQHKAEPTKGFDALAVEGSERQRARSLLDLLTEANINLREGIDPALIERERQVAKQFNDKAQTQASTPEQAAALKLEISQLETDLERAQLAIRKASPRYAALTQPQPLKLKEIQAQLGPDTLLLEYALGGERSHLWAISKDSLKSYELPKGELIDKDARLLHEMLSARSTTKRGESALQRQQRITRAEADLPAAAQALSQILLAPVAAELGNKRLVIVADGALQYIPFAMLPEPVAGNPGASNRLPTTDYRPLIVGHEVVSLPSASALTIHRSELAGRHPAPKLLAVIADPVFDRTDARFKPAATDASDKATAQAPSFNDARKIEHLADKSDDKSGVTTRRMVIPRLLFTRQEAIRLLALTPKDSSFGAMDFQASNATVLKGELGQYRYIHFATHGLVDSERPGLSSLVLSMVDVQGKAQDGFLRLHDIYNLKLPAELVVLSACQTGLGREIKGEGLVGLTRGFMYAGAARVVVSLWNVNDKATAELMTRF
jgi:CHAT domain-containing protein/tetratricopeptide (TPR) repeat protein